MMHLARVSLSLLAVRALGRAWRVLQNRRQTMKLYELSDSQLADIGLSRMDVHRALQLPLFADPSHILRDWASQNRVTRTPETQSCYRSAPRDETASHQTGCQPIPRLAA